MGFGKNFIGLICVLWVVLGYSLSSAFLSTGNGDKIGQIDGMGITGTTPITERSFIVHQAPPYLFKGFSLADLEDVPETLIRIIECESNWRPYVKNPYSSAYGLCQFTARTRRYVEKKWGIKIDWLNPSEQLKACKRLYEEEGRRHWEESVWCWGR